MYLGLDLGTSGIRALLVDDLGTVLGQADASLATHRPFAGWSEQSPSAWITGLRHVVSSIGKQSPKEFEALRGIGLSGHMHGATLLDEHDVPLRPCILWNDTRSSNEAAALDAIARMREISGNIVFPGFTAPKLQWVRLNEPDVFSRTARVLLPKDYLRLWLTGGHVSDMSDSSGTSWLDVGKRSWSEEALRLTRMSLDQMPELVEGTDRSGALRESLCKEWGVRGPVIVSGGAGDNAAAACGVGCLTTGSGFVSLGTSGVILAATDCFVPAPESGVHAFCHAVPGKWYQMGVVLAATDCLEWLARTVGNSPEGLANELPEKVDGPSKIVFLPYLSGARTPQNDASMRGVFAGLEITTSPEDLARAVMEGVAFSLRDCFEALRSTGTRLEQMFVVGGGSRSRYWLECLSTVLNLPLSCPVNGQSSAALGAARTAICAHTGASPAEIMKFPEVSETIMPRDDLLDRYEDGFQQFRSLQLAAMPSRI